MELGTSLCLSFPSSKNTCFQAGAHVAQAGLKGMTPDSPAYTCQVLGTTGVHYHGEENRLLNTFLWPLYVTVHACPHTPATSQIKEWHAGQPHSLAGRGACHQFR